MTPAQWAVFGWCVECTAEPGEPCHHVLGKTTTQVVLAPDPMVYPHPQRLTRADVTTAASIMDDLVDLSVKEGVTVRPGDTLVLRLDPDNMMGEDVSAELNQIREFIQAKVPAGARVVVLAAPGQLAVIRGDSAKRCTDLTARWCPVHGICACPDQSPISGSTQLSGPMVDPGCHLHGPDSFHGDTTAGSPPTHGGP